MAARIDLAMIVRDAEQTLEPCLASVRPWVGEANIYLAGESSDRTAELVERLAHQDGPPIRYVQGEWRDDFAWARQQSFEMVSPDADWIIYCDADDVLHGGANLQTLIAGVDDDLNIVFVPYLAVHKEAWDVVDSDRWTFAKRLFRNDRVWRWEYALHEEVVNPEQRGSVLELPDVLHFDHHRSEYRTNTTRNLALLRRQINAGARDERTLRYLRWSENHARLLGIAA